MPAIRIDPHTSDRLAERGTTTAEVEDVIRTGDLAEAHSGRFAKAKVYKYDGIWRGRFYRQKKVRVVFAMDRNTAVTVTVVFPLDSGGSRHEDHLPREVRPFVYQA